MADEHRVDSRFYIGFCKHEALELRAKKSKLRSQLQLATESLDSSPLDPILHNQARTIIVSQQTFEERKAHGAQLRARVC